MNYSRLLDSSTDFFWLASVWTGICTAAITLVVLSALFILKAQRQKKIQRDVEFENTWQPLLAQIALGQSLPLQLVALSAGDDWRMLKLWVHAQMLLRGQASEHLRQFGIEFNLRQHALHFLNGTSKAEQILGLLTLGYLQDKASTDLLKPLLHEPSNSVALYAAWAWLNIDSSLAAAPVLAMLQQRPTSDVVQAAALFKPFKNILIAPWTDQFKVLRQQPNSPHREQQTVWLLKMAHTLNFSVDASLLRPLFNEEHSADVYIGAMRLLEHASDLNCIRPFVTHSDWEIRTQVAITLGRLGDAAEFENLQTLACDSQWWVRYRAAQSLINLAGIDRENLIQTVSLWTDRYAKDMVWHVLAEKSIASID